MKPTTFFQYAVTFPSPHFTSLSTMKLISLLLLKQFEISSWKIEYSQVIIHQLLPAPYNTKSSPVDSAGFSGDILSHCIEGKHFPSPSAHTKYFLWFFSAGKWWEYCLDQKWCVYRSRKALCLSCEQTGAWKSLWIIPFYCKTSLDIRKRGQQKWGDRSSYLYYEGKLLAHITFMCLLHFSPRVSTARCVDTLSSLSSLLCIKELRLQVSVVWRTENCK